MLILFLIITYLIASIPFGLIISKTFGKKDIRKYGSKNIGATNVTRILGAKLGFLTLVLDATKGAIMVIIARKLFYNFNYLGHFLSVVAFVAVIGHVFPIYLKFKGGKGVATSIAVITAINPLMGIVSTIIWLSIFLITRISAAASLLSIFFIALFSIYDRVAWEQSILYIALLLLITYRHKDNINRISNGTENQL